MPVMALSVLALSCGAGASEGALPEVHKSVAQICAEAKQDVVQANQQYTGAVLTASGVVNRYDSEFIKDERFRLLSGDDLGNMVVVFRHPSTRTLKEGQQFKAKGVMTQVDTQFGCMILMESGRVH